MQDFRGMLAAFGVAAMISSCATSKVPRTPEEWSVYYPSAAKRVERVEECERERGPGVACSPGVTTLQREMIAAFLSAHPGIDDTTRSLVTEQAVPVGPDADVVVAQARAVIEKREQETARRIAEVAAERERSLKAKRSQAERCVKILRERRFNAYTVRSSLGDSIIVVGCSNSLLAYNAHFFIRQNDMASLGKIYGDPDGPCRYVPTGNVVYPAVTDGDVWRLDGGSWVHRNDLVKLPAQPEPTGDELDRRCFYPLGLRPFEVPE